MKKELKEIERPDDELGCFGDFSIADPICKDQCVLSLRCAVEYDQKARLEMLEDWLTTEEINLKIQ